MSKKKSSVYTQRELEKMMALDYDEEVKWAEIKADIARENEEEIKSRNKLHEMRVAKRMDLKPTPPKVKAARESGKPLTPGDYGWRPIQRQEAIPKTFFSKVPSAPSGSEEEEIDYGLVLKEFAPNNLFRVVETCKYCNRKPCFLDDNQNWEVMMKEAEELEEDGKSNKEIRFFLYQQCARLLGYTGKGNRQKLPVCATGNIKDYYPKGKDEEYVGFRPSNEQEDNDGDSHY